MFRPLKILQESLQHKHDFHERLVTREINNSAAFFYSLGPPTYNQVHAWLTFSTHRNLRGVAASFMRWK